MNSSACLNQKEDSMGVLNNGKLFFWAFILLVSLPLTVNAVELEEEDFDFKTTEDLYSLCSVAPDHPDFVASIYACRGYIAGAVDYHDGVSKDKKFKRLICYPAATTLKEGREAFVAWANARKDDAALMQELAVVGLVKALASQYPCGK